MYIITTPFNSKVDIRFVVSKMPLVNAGKFICHGTHHSIQLNLFLNPEYFNFV